MGFRDHRVQLQRPTIGFYPMTPVQILWFVRHSAVSMLISHSHFDWMDRKKLVDSVERFVLGGFSRQKSARRGRAFITRFIPGATTSHNRRRALRYRGIVVNTPTFIRT